MEVVKRRGNNRDLEISKKPNIGYYTFSDKTMSDKSDKIFHRWRKFIVRRKFCQTKYLVQQKIMSKIKI